MMKRIVWVMSTVAMTGFVIAVIVSLPKLPNVYMAYGICQYVGQLDNDGREIIKDCGVINFTEDRYNVVHIAGMEYMSGLREENMRERFEEAVRRGEHIPSIVE